MFLVLLSVLFFSKNRPNLFYRYGKINNKNGNSQKNLFLNFRQLFVKNKIWAEFLKKKTYNAGFATELQNKSAIFAI